MNGMQLGDKKLVVQRASVGSKTMPTQVTVTSINSQCLYSMNDNVSFWKDFYLSFLRTQKGVRSKAILNHLIELLVVKKANCVLLAQLIAHSPYN